MNGGLYSSFDDQNGTVVVVVTLVEGFLVSDLRFPPFLRRRCLAIK